MESQTTRNKKEKRARIFKATIKLITENGLHATPMAKIAKEANVAAGTIYIHFRNKEDLINQLYLELKGQSVAALTRGLSPSLAVKDGVQLVWNNGLVDRLKEPIRFRFLQQYTHSPYIENVTREEGLKLFHSIIGLWHRGKDDKIIRNIDDLIIYAMLFSPLDALAKQHLQGHFNLEDKKHSVFQSCWDAIKY